MNQEELATVIGKTAALMEQFDRRCGDIDSRLQSLSQQLESMALQLPAIVERSTDNAVRTLPGQIVHKLGEGLEQSVRTHEARLHDSGSTLAQRTQTLAQQLQRMERLHKHLVWKTITVTATCLLLLLGGGAWLATHYAGVIRHNQIAGELLNAYNHADVMLCGDGQLCANVQPKDKRYGANEQYLPVKPRPLEQP